MSTPVRLSYLPSHARALGIGSLLGSAVSPEKIWEGNFAAAAVAFALFTALGYWLARTLLKVVVHQKGVVVWAWRELEWTNVSAAAVSSTGLRLEPRQARSMELPRAVVEDPAFRDAIRAWLSSDNPVRRAMEQYYELRSW